MKNLNYLRNVLLFLIQTFAVVSNMMIYSAYLSIYEVYDNKTLGLIQEYLSTADNMIQTLPNRLIYISFITTRTAQPRKFMGFIKRGKYKSSLYSYCHKLV